MAVHCPQNSQGIRLSARLDNPQAGAFPTPGNALGKTDQVGGTARRVSVPRRSHICTRVSLSTESTRTSAAERYSGMLQLYEGLVQ